MAEKKKRKRGYLKRVKTPPARREEAVRLLRILAERETDLGAKGYAEGAAESIEARAGRVGMISKRNVNLKYVRLYSLPFSHE